MQRTHREGLLLRESMQTGAIAKLHPRLMPLQMAEFLKFDTQIQEVIGARLRLRKVVRDAGIAVHRSAGSILMVGNIVSGDSTCTPTQLSDIMASTIEPAIKQVEGVGSILPFGSGYAMRIWLDPLALTQYKLRPSDGTAAIQQQNTQVAVGEIGASPTTEGQQLRVTATAQTQLKTVAEFENIRLISAEDGSTVRLQDVRPRRAWP